jgi:thiamine-phosphate pyrophosphorylase
VSKASIRGLYAIADTRVLATGDLPSRVAAAIAGGVRIVQYRHKGGGTARPRNEVHDLLATCRRLRAPLIINDDVEMAARLAADGVHLGRDDTDPRAARMLLGGRAIIGVSCYDDLDRAVEAQAAGADYVAFGSFFASTTKPEAIRAPIELLQRARNQLTIPLVAIGGITAHNAARLLSAGADAIAVISGIFTEDDPCAAARRYSVLFESPPGTHPASAVTNT